MVDRPGLQSGRRTLVSSIYDPHRPKEGWGRGWEVGLGAIVAFLVLLAILAIII